jgi:hypothetical protein
MAETAIVQGENLTDKVLTIKDDAANLCTITANSDRFEFNKDIYTTGAFVGDGGLSVPVDTYLYFDSPSNSEGLQFNSTLFKFEFNDNLYVNGTLEANGHLYVPSGSFIYLDGLVGTGGAYGLRYNSGSTRYEFNRMHLALLSRDASVGNQLINSTDLHLIGHYWSGGISNELVGRMYLETQSTFGVGRFVFDKDVYTTGTMKIGAYTLPNTDGAANQVLQTNGSGVVSWATSAGAGTVTSVAAGNGLDFTTITASGSVTMGTPSTLTAATTNAVTTTSHTHAVTGFLTSVSGGDHSSLTNLTWSTAGHTINANFIPTAGTFDLGSTTYNWNNFYLNRTAGSVLFMGANGLVTQKNANLFWDNTNNRLGINTTTPGESLAVIGNARVGDASTNYINMATDGSTTWAGTARKWKSTWLNAYGAYPSAATYNGTARAAAVATILASKWICMGHAYNTGGGDQSSAAIWNLVLPGDYEDGTDIKVNVDWTANATSGVCRFGVGVLSVGDTEAYNGTEVYSVANHTKSGAAYTKQSFSTTVTGTGFAAGDNVCVVIYRDCENAADTMTATAVVPMVRIRYLSNKRGMDS